MEKFIFLLALFFLSSIKINAQVTEWAEKIAGSDYDFGNSIAVDGSGNVYVAGFYYSSTITFNNGKTLSNSGDRDAYIAKYNSSGLCQWAEKIAGSSEDNCKSITVDGSGNVYVAGYYNSTTLTFNNSNTLTNSNTSYSDAYIAKYNSSGLCQWAEKIAGSG